jgi:hypothetical protein
MWGFTVFEQKHCQQQNYTKHNKTANQITNLHKKQHNLKTYLLQNEV